jgi:hypothetical protein
LGAITLFIKNENVDLPNTNHADAEVENYQYDYVLDNSGSLGDLLEIIDVEKHNNILFRKNFNNDVELQEIVKEFILDVKNKK